MPQGQVGTHRPQAAETLDSVFDEWRGFRKKERGKAAQ